MPISDSFAHSWLESLKKSWEAGDPDGALALFRKTQTYYERPFTPGVSQEQIKSYWQDIVTLSDIVFEYEISAIVGNLVVVHWRNSFKDTKNVKTLLDGVFYLEFDDNENCISFRQWWFADE